jgi:hypothetical protein
MKVGKYKYKSARVTIHGANKDVEAVAAIDRVLAEGGDYDAVWRAVDAIRLPVVPHMAEGGGIEAVKPAAGRMEKVELILEKRYESRLDIGVIPRPVLRCGIPLKKPKDVSYLIHTSQDGNCTLKVKADPEFGMPYGRDLLTPLWLFSEAYARKSPIISFRSGREMLRSMGLNEDGRTFRWVTGSIERSFGATWEFTIWREFGGRVARDREYFKLVRRARLWFTKDRDQLDFNADGFENVIVLTEDAFALAMKRGYQARVELEVVAALSQSPGATRLFMILRDRAAEVPEHKPYAWLPLTGPLGLDLQMGVKPYANKNKRRWRQLVRGWLKEIGDHWPQCPKPEDIHEGRDGFYRLKVRRAHPVGREPKLLAPVENC